MKTTTAIVVFADVSKSEARSKKLLPELNEQANLQLLRFMTNQTCRTAHESGFPVLLVNRSLQQGKTFGERIHAAFKLAFEQGFEDIILIGNDCVDLTAKDLREAVKHLHKNQVVLGPDQRGGTWLMGLNKNTFNQLDLTQFSWQKPTLLAELLTYVGSSHTTLLSTKKDLNNAIDLKRIKQWIKTDAPSHSAEQCFFHFIDELHHFYFRNTNFALNQEKRFVHRQLMRAPPSEIAA